MKIHTALAALGFLFLSCERQSNPLAFAVEHVFDFPTEPFPVSIAADRETGHIYIANSYSSLVHDNKKIQEYDGDGKFIRTIADLAAFDRGGYSGYEPVDMTAGSGRGLYVLVKPTHDRSGEWRPYYGFCVLHFGPSGEFLREFDFNSFKEAWFPLAVAYDNGIVFVTNGYVLLKISETTGQSSEIPMPFNETDNILRFGIHASDMTITDRRIWLAGMAFFSDGTVGCHVTRLNLECGDRRTFYSRSRTEFYGAELNHPGLALDGKGRLIVSTGYCRSLEVFDDEGRLLRRIVLGEEASNTILPYGVVLGGDEDAYVLDEASGRVLVYKIR